MQGTLAAITPCFISNFATHVSLQLWSWEYIYAAAADTFLWEYIYIYSIYIYIYNCGLPWWLNHHISCTCRLSQNFSRKWCQTQTRWNWIKSNRSPIENTCPWISERHLQARNVKSNRVGNIDRVSITDHPLVILSPGNDLWTACKRTTQTLNGSIFISGVKICCVSTNLL